MEKHGALVVRSDKGVVVNLHTYTPVAKVSTQHNTTWLKELHTTSPTLNPALSFFRMLGISQGGPGLMGLFPLFLFTSALSFTIPRSSTANNHDKWAQIPEELNVAFCELCSKPHPATVKWLLQLFLQPHLWCQIISYHQDSSSTVGHSSVLLNDGAGLTVGASLDIKRPKKRNINILKIYQKFIQIQNSVWIQWIIQCIYRDLATLLIACHACAKASRTNVTGARRNSWSKAWSACTR